MSDKQIIALIRLSLIPGMGPVNSRKLIQYFERPEAIFTDEWPEELTELSKKLKAYLADEKYLKRAESSYSLALKLGIRVVSFQEELYPHYLNQCPDAPLLLFCKGAIQPNRGPALAVVGTRKMTPYGRDFCKEFIQDLKPHNPIIISGLAYGVDICGQRAALENGLQTIACLAHGLDSVYPQSHQRDAQKILDHGGLISEFLPGISPRPEYFLRRNRLIAGMAQATVVIETGEKGGSLVTADYALGYHREVFAVPGRINDPQSAGCNRLIAHQRAQLLRNARELAEYLNWEPAIPPKSLQNSKGGFSQNWPPSWKTIASCLRNQPKCPLDQLLRETKIPLAELSQELFLMELEGFIRVSPGKSYSWAL